jgi:phage terminase Nu1 subunit (DNA packaging protein)
MEEKIPNTMDKVINEQTMMEILGVNARGLVALRTKGMPRIPAYKGKYVFYDDDVAAWLRKQTVTIRVKPQNKVGANGSEND